MSPAPKKRINPKFLELCNARLNSIETRLASIEMGWRYPDIWQVNIDLECMANWTFDIPDLRKRVEDLGDRYSKIAFVPHPGLPPKFIPRQTIIPSRRPGQIETPMSEDEAAGMIAALTEDGFPIENPGQGRTSAMTHVWFNRKFFHTGCLRGGLAAGLIRGDAATRLDALLQTLLVAMSGSGIMTMGIKQASRTLADAFPYDADWFEKRFSVIRRSLIKEGYLKRAGKSFWLRVDQRDNSRVKAAFELLDRLVQAGAETVAAECCDANKSEVSDE